MRTGLCAALMLLAIAARAEEPAVQLCAIRVDGAAFVDGKRAVRLEVPLSSRALVGRTVSLRFHLAQEEKQYDESRTRSVVVETWLETAYYPRAFLAKTFDPRRPLAVRFQLVDVASGRALATGDGVIPADLPTPPERLLLPEVVVQSGGRVLYRGPMDLRPTVDRIRADVHYPHRRDGAVFGNRERRLPPRPEGYYHEYVHPTAGVHGPGPQRLVIGAGGEMFYTSDHYRTFIPIP